MAASVRLPPTGDLETPAFDDNYILFWNSVLLNLSRLTNTGVISGPQGEPPAAARTYGITHLAIHDAYFAINPDSTGAITPYLDPNSNDPSVRLPSLDGANDARLAVAGAAATVLRQLFGTRSPEIATLSTDALLGFLDNAVLSVRPILDTTSSSYRFGIAVGQAMLNLLDIKPGEPGFSQLDYQPTPGQFKFDDDPTNPIRIVPVDPNNPTGATEAIRVYDAPFYGMTAKRIAVQGTIQGAPTKHILADPPVGFGTNDQADYNWAFDDVYREGTYPTLL